MIALPEWVSEGSIRKYHRALATLTREKKPLTEEAIKELYVKDGGLVLGAASTVQGVPPGAEEEAEERASTTQNKAPAKKRAAKPKADEVAE